MVQAMSHKMVGGGIFQMMDDRERQIADLQRYLDDWQRRWHRQQEIRKAV